MVRQGIQWLAALLAAVLLCNAFLLLYHDPAVWIPQENGPTDAIWRPGARILMGTEGRGIHRVDSRGYLNPEKPLAERFVLVVGSSFAQGKEVAAGERFTDILNRELSEDAETLAVYNVSQDGFYLPDILRCFPALMREFPGARTLVIEIGTTSFPETAFVPMPATAGERVRHLPAMPELREALPILTVAKAQLTALLLSETAEEPVPAGEETLKRALLELRQRFAGEILILYHPAVSLSDGGMAIAEEETTPAFRAACREAGVTFVDTSDAFLAAYEKAYLVPYGFFNTTMGSGHLNAHGHMLCAEVLLPLLKGGGSE